MTIAWTSYVRRLATVLAVGLITAAAVWLAWNLWGWPRGAADGGQRNDNAIFIGTALLTVYLAGVALWWTHRHGRAARAAGADEPEKRDESPVHDLTIGDDGHFLGGDETATTLVVDVLEVPAAARSVRVRATALDDAGYRLKSPHQYVQLRECVRAYETSLGRLLRGRVHYYVKWEVEDLVEAVLELRRIELPAQYHRQWWYCWDPSDPAHVVRVGLDAKDVKSVQTGSYGPPRDGRHDVEAGVPPDEPIWVVSLFPAIVWRRVVPAVVVDQRRNHPGPTEPPVLDITDWVVSNRRPSELARSRPREKPVGYRPAAWQW